MFSALTVLLYTVHVVVSLFLILVVLLQQGSGADLSVFGGGASQAAFGARGAANILHRLTVACFVVFIVTTLSIGLVQGRESGFLSAGDAPEVTEGAVEDLAGTAAATADEAATAVEGAASDAADAVPDAVATPAEAATEAPAATDDSSGDGG